ncbi:hypothetical protein L9F63_004546 [Diploptera punctata]|uniref:Poly [ADP-ribose] polymerase n=1 Tax=Diploptera punctata TaxID=6984 RepID=A0AAD7ZFP7_DIPPU|nr:hypothetical protein L9F63_004546 [Diploptera punctata]
MEGDHGETLREPEAFHQKHRAAFHQQHRTTDGIDVQTQSSTTDIGSKAIELRNMLENDLQAADVKWSLFVAACQSYRYDSCLKPFPPQFILNGVKDIDSLREVVEKTPSLILLTQYLYDPEAYQRSPQVIDLLYWVLVHLRYVRMQSIPKSEFESVLECVHCETPAPPPDLIFQLQHLNKNSLFGRGIYLSSELSVSLPYSSMGYSWGRSVLGGQLSCVALCEVVDHPDVKCQDKDSSKSRSLAKDSIGGEVPQKYYVAMNSDLVRVRYLLVYSNFTPRSDETADKSRQGWFGRNKILTCFLVYILVLASVGLSKNRAIQHYYHQILKRIGL